MGLRLLTTTLAFLPTTLSGLASAASCTNFAAPTLPGAEVLWVKSNPVADFSLPSDQTRLPEDAPKADFCNVSVALTHPGDNDTVFVTVWLPHEKSWNGRYTATGGGGLAAGYDINMLQPLLSSFATSSTDGGLTLNHTINPQSGIWGTKHDGAVNEALLLNLAHRSIHDMSVVSKQIIKQFYKTDPTYSYWLGCSQGGRQGYAAAAHYPDDFNGVLAMAPALSSEYIGPGDFWPVIVMENEGEIVPTCVFEAFQAAIVELCDPLDGVTDGMISDYDLLLTCPFDPKSIVGDTIDCEETGAITISQHHATIVSKILEGPHNDYGERLWYGLAHGATFSGVANTTLDNDILTPQPFPPSAGWLRGMIIRNTSYNIFDMTIPEYLDAFNTSIEQGGPIFGLDTLDLTSFHSFGGKLLTWVGLADEYIHPSNLLKYYHSVEEKLNNTTTNINDFYRIFTAPGVGHCHGGVGPQPLNAMTALVDWVENGIAPETLPVQSNTVNGKVALRDLCLYPKKPVYNEGDDNSQRSFSCKDPRKEEQGKDESGDGDEESGAKGLFGGGSWCAVGFGLVCLGFLSV
ncbi:Tannase/feruloyl esterase [Aspergillus lucknowensis]|uniref:Carboxylic ester hydrolase n=1 Tax=Aspergillus lucknowensis TaxID=176173 RepID=A0ABR4M1N7_9EURO